MEDIRGRKGKLKGGKSEGETNHERLWTLGNKLRASERRGVEEQDRLVMGIKGACIAWCTGCYTQGCTVW